jgi:hypothetical protein
MAIVYRFSMTDTVAKLSPKSCNSLLFLAT